MLGVVALAATGCSAGSPGSATSSVAQTAARGEIVIPEGLARGLIDRYAAAVADLGGRARVVEGPVADGLTVALGGAVPGATIVVQPDPVATGRMLAESVVRCLNDGGIVRGPVVLIDLPDRVDETATAVLTNAGFTASSNDMSPADAYRVADGDIVAVLAGTDEAAAGAVVALDGNAQAGKVVVAGFGSDDRTRARLADGSQCAAVRPAVRKEARRAVELASRLTAGASVEPSGPVGGAPVDLVAPILVRPGDAPTE